MTSNPDIFKGITNTPGVIAFQDKDKKLFFGWKSKLINDVPHVVGEWTIEDTSKNNWKETDHFRICMVFGYQGAW